MAHLVLMLFVIAISFTSILCLITLSQGDYICSVFFFAGTVLLFKSLLGNKHYKSLEEKRKKRLKEIQTRRYIKTILNENMIRQILESVELIEKTKKYEVFISRYDFLQKLLAPFIDAYKIGDISEIIKNGINFYNRLYPDRTLSESQKDILANPQNYTTNDYLAQWLVSFYSRFTQNMIEEQQRLKTKKAKDLRTQQIYDCSLIIRDKLRSIGMDNYIQKIIDITFENTHIYITEIPINLTEIQINQTK